jgi:iron(III) transport system permease protein
MRRLRSARSAMQRWPVFVLIPALLAAVATLVPIAYLLLRALSADPATVLALVWRERTLRLLLDTMTLTGGVLLVTTAIALPLAWLVARSDLPGKRIVSTLAVVPLAIPGYVIAYALIGLGGNQGVLSAWFGGPVPRPSGLGGAVAALSLYTFPYLFLNVRSALAGLDPSLEESARSLGLGSRAVWWRVIVPQLRPALLSGYLVIALYVLGDFGVVALMRFEAFSYAIYLQYASAFDRTYAAWLSLLLLMLTTLILFGEHRALGSRRYARTGGGGQRLVVMMRLGRGRYAAWAFIAVVIAASVGLPVLVLGHWLLQAPPSAATLQAVGIAFARTASVALPAALLTAGAALAVAYLSSRYPSGGARAIERVTYLGYAIPPVALALALVFFALRSVPWLYQSIPMLIGAYGISFLALAIGPLRSALLQAPYRLEEAARSLGRRPITAFFEAVVPGMRRSLLAATAMVWLVAMKELPLSFLLAPTGFTTLSVRVFTRTQEGMMAEAAPYALAIVLFSTAFVGTLIGSERR